MKGIIIVMNSYRAIVFTCEVMSEPTYPRAVFVPCDCVFLDCFTLIDFILRLKGLYYNKLISKDNKLTYGDNKLVSGRNNKLKMLKCANQLNGSKHVLTIHL